MMHFESYDNGFMQNDLFHEYTILYLCVDFLSSGVYPIDLTLIVIFCFVPAKSIFH